MIRSCIQLLTQGEKSPTTALISLGAHFAFGAGLLLAVAKFFDYVEGKLDSNTRNDIAEWLLDLRPSSTIGDWRHTFPKIFDRIFGENQLSPQCFSRSVLASVITQFIVIVAGVLLVPPNFWDREFGWIALVYFGFIGLLSNIIPDYLSLWKTRFLLRLGRGTESVFLHLIFLLADIVLSMLAACAAVIIGMVPMVWGDPNMSVNHVLAKATRMGFASLPMAATCWFIPAFFGRLWLLAYVGSGLIVKTARRLDIGVTWFNNTFDILNQPLQCIGLVAGTLCALGYWALAVIHLIP